MHRSDKKRKNNKKLFDRRLRSYFKEFEFRASDWLITTLGILVVECLLLVGNVNVWDLFLNTSSFEGLFFSPLIPALITIVFCIAFTYKTIQRKKIGTYAIIIATLLSLIGLLFLFGITPSKEQCSGLFGVMQSCSEVYRFQITILFLNPISLMIEGFLALTATLALYSQGNKK